MFRIVHHVGRAMRWQALRRRIRQANHSERMRLIRQFGGEIRSIMPNVLRSPDVERDHINRALEIANSLGAIIGGWLQIDPGNPTWPGRDRLFVIRREDLINACSVLAVIGCFSPDVVAEMVEKVDLEGSRAYIPGIESPGVPTNDVPNLMWESALESARSKRSWREKMEEFGNIDWAEPDWVDSPAAWRTCGIFDNADPVTAQCRDLLLREGDNPAGLVAVVKAGREEAFDVADAWADVGWDVDVIHRSDCVGIYELLSETVFDTPLAIIVGVGQSGSRHFSRSEIRRRESGLLGEMSDEQFNEIMGESLKG